MAYSILNQQDFELGQYKITSIRDEDKLSIMHWRNDQMDILRQSKPLTENDQISYFANVVAADFNSHRPHQILFSYLKANELIGYGGLVHLNWVDKRGEVSFLLETKRNQDIDLFRVEYEVFLILIKHISFNLLGLNKITTEAFDVRPYLIETLEKNNFVLEGRLVRHNIIQGKYVDSLLHAAFNES